MHIYIHLHTFTLMCIHTYTFYVCVHTYTFYVYTYIPILRVYITYIYTHVYTYIHIYIHTHRMGTLFVAAFPPLICNYVKMYPYKFLYTYRPVRRHTHSYSLSYIHMQTLKMYRLDNLMHFPRI